MVIFSLSLISLRCSGPTLTSTQLLFGTDHRHDLTRGVDRLDGGDRGDDAGVGFDLGRLSVSGVDEDERNGESKCNSD